MNMPLQKSKISQEFLNIKYIKNDTVFMEDGSVRAVIAVSGVSMALKSEEERMAIISQFEQFLNTIDFSVQLLVQSRALDLSDYLNQLKEIEKNQTNEILRIQTKNYINFIEKFVEEVNIMVKNFFIVVPYHYSISEIKTNNPILSIFQTPQNDNNSASEKIKIEQLDQRVSIIFHGAKRMGIESIYRLNTEDLIKLYYNIFNPGDKLTSKNISRYAK